MKHYNSKNHASPDDSIAGKTNKVLQITLFIFLTIIFRIWHLTVLQRDTREQDSLRAQRKTVVLHPDRGTIYDRYNLPLALNRICYNATVYYADIRQIPAVLRKTDQHGLFQKQYLRKEHIRRLSELLAQELDLDADRVEDEIHAKASLLPHAPYIIKENISEDQYFRLRMIERDFTGLHAEAASQRYYPQGKTAGDIIGYLGAISREEYLAIARELKTLIKFAGAFENLEEPPLPIGYKTIEDIYDRLSHLRQKAYSASDQIGKAGIEGRFEPQLRGCIGKKIYSVDVRGNFLEEQPCSLPPIPGQKINLSISMELQEFAEKLLIADEKERDGANKVWDSRLKTRTVLPQPWIKGGAIVVLDPKSGQVLALASLPRINPGDFVSVARQKLWKIKQQNIHKWLESPRHIANLFDNKVLLEREVPAKKGLSTETKELSWQEFLHSLMPPSSAAAAAMKKIANLQNAIAMQEDVEALLFFAHQKEACPVFDILFPKDEGHIIAKMTLPPERQNQILSCLAENAEEVFAIKRRLAAFFEGAAHNGDKLLIADLCRIAVYSSAFSDELIAKVKEKSLAAYWEESKAAIRLEEKLKTMLKKYFHTHDFKSWQKEHSENFIRKKRASEKRKKTYARPYIEYLDIRENKLFEQFYRKYRSTFLVSFFKFNNIASSGSDRNILPYIQMLSDWQQKHAETGAFAKDFARILAALAPLDPSLAVDYLKTFRGYDLLDRPLFGRYSRLRTGAKPPLEKDLAAAFYPRQGFGYGRSCCYRESATMGSVFKLITAYAALKQRFLEFAKPPAFHKLNPFTMIDMVRRNNAGGPWIVGYTLKNKPYYRFYKGGRLPRSSHWDIGQIDILSAIERSSNPYFALLAGDYLKSPQQLLDAARDLGFGLKTGIDLPGEITGYLPKDVSYNKTGLYSFAIGQHSLIATPLQAALMLSAFAGGQMLRPQIISEIAHEPPETPISRTLFLPASVQQMLLRGMDLVVSGEKGQARPAQIKKFWGRKELYLDYKALKHKLIGKTSTAELLHTPYILPSYAAKKYKDIWFASLYYPQTVGKGGAPELCIVVYLKYGESGKEAAPIAAQIIKEYERLKQKYN